MNALRDPLQQFLRHYLVALQFFTRVPVTGPLADWTGYSPEMLRASAAHFPGVGLLVGMVACVAFAVASVLLPATPFEPLVAAFVCAIATALLTGAFHEDGLADAMDGLGGSAVRERALEIMKDSRIGSFGAVALVLVLGLKMSLLAALASRSPAAVLAALLAGHTVSRFWPLLVVHTLPHVGDTATSKSKPLAESIGRRALYVAAAWCLLPLALMAAAQGIAFMLLAVLASGLALLAMRRWFAHRLQGFTGDCLGATQQVCEVAFYLGSAVGIGVG
ncbi:adenosylcobinamide-GDP ribazoletransferase [Ramlibacter sp.]|uniref:adenosylcobinamide-GDP ribazoletransferase n=1 Tax=Ramlibacter sp. TaxID=1917967 RepID=UPI0025E68AEF|nr:adenosylcobinamide-GDP ribazoletransferase [Ramlibacter sp.]